MISLAVPAIAVLALYGRHLAGFWRAIYAAPVPIFRAQSIGTPKAKLAPRG